VIFGDNVFLNSGLDTVYISDNNPLGIQSPSNGPVNFYGAVNVNILQPTQQS